MDKTPIIFIHYGDSEYLKYTLDLAKKNNPEKRIILLGDTNNQKYKKLGIEHISFDKYNNSEEIRIFDKVYKFIAGKSQRKKDWTNFVFKRWFYIYNFIKSENINQFWTFDSDTLILNSLSQFEKDYKEFDCTEQCNGICMNGLINNQRVVEGYIKKINELFVREDYLKTQEKEFENHPDWAFTEMRAYATYKAESNIKTIRLNTILNHRAFDECICQEDEMETRHIKETHRPIKKLYFKNSKVYEKLKESGELIEIQTINMSWVPLWLIERVYFYVSGRTFFYYFFNRVSRYLKRIFRM